MAMAERRSMRDWLDGYGESHQNTLNKTIHWLAVPLIFLTVVGLLWSVPLPGSVVASPWGNLATPTQNMHHSIIPTVRGTDKRT